MSAPVHENCGGTILAGCAGDDYSYCDRCRAYACDGLDFPSGGVPERLNREAWDNGDDASPYPESFETAEEDAREDWSSPRYRRLA